MAFSGALTLTDLNDFITPSLACIKPVEQTNKPEPQDAGAAATEIQVDSSGLYYEVSATSKQTATQTGKDTKQKLATAEISLNDCLACSGCITSAESVLITMQSHTEVLNFLENNPPSTSQDHKVPVISIAPQCLASLAASISSTSSQTLSLLQVLRRVTAFCQSALGFAHVYDTTFARHISLLEHAKEFAERKKGDGKLPMLASACPGWVCYAEKTHSEMLPYISQTKSPQQVMGTLVKEWLGAKWGKQPDQIYHVTVMPCYDKKLEASRQDFYSEVYSTRDVDCVITTGELQLLMQDKGWELSMPVPDENLPPRPHPTAIDAAMNATNTGADHGLPELLMHPGTSSGSYMHSLISTLTSTAADPSVLELSTKTVRTADYEEYTLTDRSTGAVVFRGAKCYGFRNLQNVVRKVGREAGVQVGRGAAGRMAGLRARGRAVRRGGTAGTEGAPQEERGYDYVEVMACPGGCVNGGGQLRPVHQASKTTTDAEGLPRDWAASGVQMDIDEPLPAVPVAPKWGDREWTRKVETAYWHTLPTPPPTPPAEGFSSSFGSKTGSVFDNADELAGRVLVEITGAAPSSEGRTAWASILDVAAEERRRTLFRTQYRAVESEVVGLAVKW
ncbi:iron hydrogenase [Trametes versicolor FP-101664 SS1]|uniref:iron hydrogenase n=1 Tax=Trametes versicolor (strain FP-101664) TaxID=717944 RepID=UPI0004624739|nr:iron hydrogenase [Trametes versicolor FP-101664 SS1]EIW63112.1 iron hydrogenase [Trametes versicolor FP-101664 SS1]